MWCFGVSALLFVSLLSQLVQCIGHAAWMLFLAIMLWNHATAIQSPKGVSCCTHGVQKLLNFVVKRYKIRISALLCNNLHRVSYGLVPVVHNVLDSHCKSAKLMRDRPYILRGQGSLGYTPDQWEAQEWFQTNRGPLRKCGLLPTHVLRSGIFFFQGHTRLDKRKSIANTQRCKLWHKSAEILIL